VRHRNFLPPFHEFHRFAEQRIHRCLFQIAGGNHVIEDHVPTGEGPIGIIVVVVGSLEDSYPECTLQQIERFDVLVEVVAGSLLDPVGAVGEVDLVQEHREDLVLGEIALQGDGGQLFPEFPDVTLLGADTLIKEVPGQLLGDRAGA